MRGDLLPCAIDRNNSIANENELCNEKQTKRDREIWLDGLRGVAAAIVSWFHFTSGLLPLPYRSFWDEPAEQNRHIIQLPLLRLWISGPAMVNVFFVLSGYSISISLLRFRDKEDSSHFYRKLSSAVLRRAVRLYIPVLVTLLISHTIFYSGIDHLPYSKGEGCPEAQPLSDIWPHFQCFQASLLTTINLAGNFGTVALNLQLWSIPPEFYCSLWLYLTIAGFAHVKPTFRIVASTVLCFSLLYYGKIIFSGFLAGLLFAELDIFVQSRKLAMGLVTQAPKHISLSTLCRKIGAAIFLSMGIYLLSLPVKPVTESGFPPDYDFQSSIELPYWPDRDQRVRGWQMLGAILTVGNLRSFPFLKAIFETSIAQFLGKISFSLYLIHPLFYHVFRESVLSSVTLVLWGKDFWHTEKDDGSGLVLTVAWLVGIATIAPILTVASVYMTKHVDQRAVSLAHKAERMICEG